MTPKDAADLLAAVLAAEKAKPAVTRATVVGRTFGEAVAAYLAHVEQDGIAPSTLRRYRGIAKALAAEFGEGRPIERITTTRIDEYRERLLREDRARSSVRQTMIVLTGILKRAQRDRWISHNPALDVERVSVRAGSGDFNVLEPAQVEAVARAAHGDWERVKPGAQRRTRIPATRARAFTSQRKLDAEIRVAAYTGLRLGELRALRWRDLDFDREILHVRRNAPTSAPAGSREKAPKSGLVRSVPLTPMAAGPLDILSRREYFTDGDDYVFPSPTGGVIDGGEIRDAFYRALTKAKLGHLRQGDDPIVFHDLRHTFGSLAVRVFPVPDVQAMMGHADIGTTMRYVHHRPQHDAAERLARAFAIEVNPLAESIKTP